jgi:hypothetical protein
MIAYFYSPYFDEEGNILGSQGISRHGTSEHDEIMKQFYETELPEISYDDGEVDEDKIILHDENREIEI